MMSWFTFSSDKSNKASLLPPTPKALASLAILTSSFFALQNVAQRLAGTVGLYAGRAMPITTTVGLIATTASICGSNYAAHEFERFWDKEVDKIPTRKSKLAMAT